jgi:hypothetical protein
MSDLKTRAWPGAGPSRGRWVRPRLRLGPAVLLSAGALLGLPAAGVTVALAPASAGVVTVASAPAAVSGGFNGDSRTGPALPGASITQIKCCPPLTSRTPGICTIC